MLICLNFLMLLSLPTLTLKGFPYLQRILWQGHCCYIREATCSSTGSVIAVYSMELKHTITLISVLNKKIDDIEAEVKAIMDKLSHSIHGINFRMDAMIIFEIDDISRFPFSDKLPCICWSPSLYLSIWYACHFFLLYGKVRFNVSQICFI